jgi:outer membrane receptor for ferrienterochelin and colicin
MAPSAAHSRAGDADNHAVIKLSFNWHMVAAVNFNKRGSTMKNKYRRLHSSTFRLLQGGLALSLAVLLVALPVVSNAQETTSSIRGKVLDSSGATVSGANVVVADVRSGVERNLSTNAAGTFLATRLLPGGPYQITVNGVASVEVASISLGDIYNITINLPAQEEIEEIVAVGQQSDIIEVAAGPSATFSLADIENSVGFNRDISDVYGIDPRMMIDVDEDGIGINCGGKHPRFNSTTLDGVNFGDRFGLNENGYSTAVGMPFPYDAIEQIAVELAPFDVNYGGFSACVINSVTKSGTNEWEAKAFYELSNQSLRGDTVADNPSDFGRDSYDKDYLGFNVGGPIIKDKLFFFAAYEERDEPRFLAKGYDGQGSGEERDWMSQADYQRIIDIAENIYGYDPGGAGGDGSQETEKYMVRLDWNINDDHNAALIYNYFDGFQDRDSDGDDNEFEYANHYYVKGAESETITFKLSSQWTDAFSTEFFYSDSTMDDSQVTVGDPTFADSQISIGGRTGTAYLGADDSRQANSLDTSSEFLKLSANMLVGNHVLTFGYDREDVEIFNIFVQHSRGGEYDYFDDSQSNDAACDALTAQGRHDDILCGTSGIDKFELGRPSRIYYGSAGETNNRFDAAAQFSNTLNALYVQDEMFFDDAGVTVVAGLRYEWFESSDRPKFHQNFFDASGIRNDANIDGVSLLMPRLGVTWEARDNLTLRGGIGLYSGGNPNVWISNAWSNDGITNVQPGGFSGWDEEDFFPTGQLPNGDPATSFTIFPGFADSIALTGTSPNRDVPQQMFDFIEASTALTAQPRGLVLIDPNYKQPSEWKFAIGGTWDMEWLGGMTLDFDYLHTRGDNPAHYRDVSQTIVGETLAGSPIYDYYTSDTFGVEARDNLMLTNSSANPTSDMLSFVLSKYWDNGLSARLGYAYIDGDDVASMIAATANSNFTGEAVTDINVPGASTSNWVVPQRVTLSLFYENEFFGNARTRFSLQGFWNEGQAQSYVMDSSQLEGDGFNGRHLLYVPDGPNDPNVVYDWDDPAMMQEFFDFIERENLKPGFSKRNAYHTGWSNVWHLTIRQEVPLGETLWGNVYFKVKNLGNLLNDDWGKITDAQFFPPEVLRDVNLTPTGQFEYEEFDDQSLQRTYVNPSLWEIRFGIDIRFGT